MDGPRAVYIFIHGSLDGVITHKITDILQVATTKLLNIILIYSSTSFMKQTDEHKMNVLPAI